MGLTLILIKRLQDCLNVIIGELNKNYEFYNKQIDFLNYLYFIKKWCTAKKSKQNPEIWNQHKAINRTNSCLESFYYAI